MSSNLGVGVMLGMLGGNADTVDNAQAAIGKTISRVAVEDDELRIEYAEGGGVRLFDDGQSCCESRYMVCDDDLSGFVGATIHNIELRDGEAPPDEGHWGEHEVQFLVVTTNQGAITVSNHNEHNGYYGGFWVVARPLDPTH